MSTDDPVRVETVSLLQLAYAMEIETVANYLAASINPGGVRAEEIKEILAADVQDELVHARRLARRLKQLGGTIPLACEMQFNRSALCSVADQSSIAQVMRGVIADEEAAIKHYQEIVRHTEGEDYVTQDLCIQLLADEEAHRALYQSFLTDFGPDA